MRFAALGSGSEGNSLVVEAGGTRLMLDCGFGLRETVARLGRLGLAPEDLSGILVTHEHSDHIGGVAKIARRYGLSVWLTHGSHAMLAAQSESFPDCHIIDSHSVFSIQDIEIQPFPVPHDAREPVQYVFGDGARRLGVLTDTGHITPHVVTVLSHCHGLVLECNHDREMLNNGPYPPRLKERVGGRFGHLDNDAAAELLHKIEKETLQHIVAAHLSRKNNTPDLARLSLAKALNCEESWIGLADQDEGFGWRQLV